MSIDCSLIIVMHGSYTHEIIMIMNIMNVAVFTGFIIDTQRSGSEERESQ